MQTRALWISAAGGVGIPAVLFTLGMFVGDALEHRWGLGWLTNILRMAIIAPMALWERVFPPMQTGPAGPTDKAIVATLLTVFLFYAALTYVIQLIAGRARA